MGDFYIKNKQGKFLPIDVKSIFGKDLDGKLVIVRVGTDEQIASANDLDETEESFNRADVLNELDDVSIIITPYQIDVSVSPQEDLEEKSIFLQITSGNDVGALEEQIRKMYNKLKNKHQMAVVPTPLKVSEYRKVQEILKRCEIRRERRSGKSKF
jgi:hypothetical protein